MKNGEFFKQVTSEITGAEFINKMQHIKRRDKNNEISHIIYLQKEKLLISSSWDSTIHIYDEEDPEESVLLKILSGGHQDSEISALSYSIQYFLIASGSNNGIVAIWDIEKGNLEMVFLEHKGEITVLQFIENYPLLASGSTDGSVCVWGLKASKKFQYQLIVKIVNSQWINNVEQVIAITSLVACTSEMIGVNMSQQLDKYYPPNYGTNIYPNKKPKEEVQEEKKKINKGLQQTEKAEPIGRKTKVVRDDFIENDEFETFIKFQRYYEKYEQTQKESRHRCYIVYGDAKGYLSVVNLTEFLQVRDITYDSKQKLSQGYQLHRKDVINATKQVDTLKQQLLSIAFPKDVSIYPYKTVLLQKWEAHSTSVCKLEKLDKPVSVVSCATDKTVKIFSLEGEVFANVSLVKFNQGNVWRFPFNWVGQKLEEFEFALSTMQELESENLDSLEKKTVKCEFLVNKYFPDGFNYEKEMKVIEQQEQMKRLEEDVDEKSKMVQVAREQIQQNGQKEYKRKERELLEYKSRLENLKTNIKQEVEGTGQEKEKKQTIEINEERFIPAKEEIKQLIEKSKDNNRELEEIHKFNKMREDEKTDREKKLKQQQHFHKQTQLRPSTTGADKNYQLSLIQGLDSIYSQPQTKETEPQKLGITDRLYQKKVKQYDHDSEFKKIEQIQLPVGIQSIQKSKKSGLKKETKQKFMSTASSQFGMRAQTSEQRSRFPFVMISPQKFLKNQAFIKNIIQSTSFKHVRPISEAEELQDVKYKTGEGMRALKLATIQQDQIFESASPLVKCNDNVILQKKKKFYKDLRGNLNSLFQQTGENKDKQSQRQLNSQKQSRTQRKNSDDYEIVAPKTFMTNPLQNKHKILKTKNKLIVIKDM